MGASIPPGGCSLARPGAGVQHAACDIELPGEGPCQALFTLPANYLSEGGVKDIGIVLGHGDRAEDWRGPLLTGLAEALASAGDQGGAGKLLLPHARPAAAARP